ncbi:processed acidic surface protein [Bacillus massilinigeriensis]|uniref:processed acidic surface protein n=1 Tax=Bacillus mediterraneensis TaxID=1805474 RepID=UPI0008F842A5|nr:processed acidic surface protein [Bacillus mediterraneensis]
MRKLIAVLMAILLVAGGPAAQSFAAFTEQDLDTFLKSEGITKEQLADHLEYYYDTVIDDFESIQKLDEFLGAKIDESNLKALLGEFGFANETELVAFLAENGEMESNENVRDIFIYEDALRSTVEFYQEEPMFDDAELQAVLAELGIGLSEAEAENLANHFMSLDLENPAFLEKLMNLASRLDAIGEFDSATDLTPQQIRELVSLYKEGMNLLNLNAKYYLVKDGAKTPISQDQLMTLEDTNGSDVLIEFYNKQGTFLADILLTAEMFGSNLIDGVDEVVAKAPVVKDKGEKGEKPQTVKGGKLPNTAGDYAGQALLGAALLAAGFVLFRKRNARIQ